MKKLLYIVAVVSLASVTGLSGVALGDEKSDPEIGGNTWVQMAQQKNWNSSKSNTSTVVKKSRDNGDKGDDIQRYGDPLKGLNVERAKKGISTDGDKGDAAQAKDFNTTRSNTQK